MQKAAILRFGCGLSFGLRHRVLTISWLKKTSVTRTFCLNQRDYSSLGPVRYVPKKSRKIDERLTSEPVDVNRSNHLSGSKAKSDINVIKEIMLLDPKKQDLAQRHKKASCDDFRQESEEGDGDIKLRRDELIKEYNGIYDEVRVDINEDKSEESSRTSKQDAESTAIKYLALRAYSSAELKKKLIGKRFPLDIVDGVITDFQYRGLINDGLYAESFSRSRWSSSTWGPRRIKQALYKKGVSNLDADAAIKLVFEEEEDKREGGGDEEKRHGMSKQAVDQLYVQASKQWLKGRDVTWETRKARLIRWLQYRGFNWGVISLILQRLDRVS